MRFFGKLLLFALVLSLPTVVNAQCTTLKDGTLTYSSGHYLYAQPLKPGFDAFGYNYQAHLFNGSYANAYLGRDGFPPYEGDDAAYLSALTPQQQTIVQSKWYWPYRTTTLSMKWNDAWLSNKDCDGNGVLDRYYGFSSYVGSGAWLTNHMADTYADGVHWTYFVKIVAAPTNAVNGGDGKWYLDGTEMGLVIWGAFAVIQRVSNDRFLQEHGLLYKSPVNPGFGFYANEP